VEKNLVTVSNYRSATSYKNVLNSRDRLKRSPFNNLLTV